MKTIKTSELAGPALDWAVCESLGQDYFFPDTGPQQPEFSEDWSQAGPIIEREEIELHVIPDMRIPSNWANCKDEDHWTANIWPDERDLIIVAGPTPLIAAMRCYVASKLGDEIGVPEELC